MKKIKIINNKKKKYYNNKISKKIKIKKVKQIEMLD